MTILEEMLLAFQNKIKKKTEKQAEINKNATIREVKIHSAARRGAYKQVCRDLDDLIKKIVNMANYKGNGPNYLLCKPRVAAGIYFNKHPEKSKKEKKSLDED